MCYTDCMKKKDIFRILDVNINRVCEGLRVVEDVIRFMGTDDSCRVQLKEIRHALRKDIGKDLEKKMLLSRNAEGDRGKHFDPIEVARPEVYDLLRANFLRAQEGLRSIEEVLKLEPSLSGKIEKVKSFRFEIYTIEKKILLSILPEQKL